MLTIPPLASGRLFTPSVGVFFVALQEIALLFKENQEKKVP